MNTTMYNQIEKFVRAQIGTGANVYYLMVPPYHGDDPRPYAVDAAVTTSTGLFRICSFANTDAGTATCIGDGA